MSLFPPSSLADNDLDLLGLLSTSLVSPSRLDAEDLALCEQLKARVRREFANFAKGESDRINIDAALKQHSISNPLNAVLQPCSSSAAAPSLPLRASASASAQPSIHSSPSSCATKETDSHEAISAGEDEAEHCPTEHSVSGAEHRRLLCSTVRDWQSRPERSMVSMAAVWESSITSLQLAEKQQQQQQQQQEHPVRVVLLDLSAEQHLYSCDIADPEQANALIQLLACKEICKISFGWKELVVALLSCPELHTALVEALPLPSVYDPKVAAWLLNPDLQHDDLLFSAVLVSYCNNIQREDHSKAAAAAAAAAAEEQLLMRDLHACYGLWQATSKALKQAEMSLVFENQEMPLVSLLARMEFEGVPFNASLLASQRRAVDCHLHQLEERAALFSSQKLPFNLQSPEQCAKVLFDQLKLQSTQRTATGLRRSTSEEVLEKLKQQHLLPALILEHRRLHKLLRTYLDPLVSAACGRDSRQRRAGSASSRVHCQWNQLSTATGRLSSSGPNLQNLPKRSSTFEPRQCTTPTAAPLTINIRLAFVCSSPLMRLVCADYCQMEVRVFALLAGERSLLDESQKADVYAQLAVRIFDLPSPAMVSDAQREKAKTLSLAIIYGMSPAAISKSLSGAGEHHYSFRAAKQFRENFMAQFPKMRQFISSTIARCRSCGYVMTITGRRRYLPDIFSSDESLRNAAERQAVNTRIQGSAADIVKCAIVHVHKELASHYQSANAVRLLLQIHDEIVLECDKRQVDEVAALVQKSMQENPLLQKIRLFLPVKLKVGPSLGNLQVWPAPSDAGGSPILRDAMDYRA